MPEWQPESDEFPTSQSERQRWWEKLSLWIDFFIKLAIKHNAPRSWRRALNSLDNALGPYQQLDWQCTRDDEANARTRLSDDESITWPAIWVTEVFTPSHYEELLSGLKRTGWERPRFAVRSEYEVRDWVARQRESPGGQGWRGVASVTQKGVSNFLHPDARRDRLPKEFDAVDVSIVAVSPSITVVIAGFRLSDECSKSLDAILRTDTTSRIVRRAGGRFVESADRRKEHDVDDQRQQVHNLARRWLSARLPGVFAVELAGKLPCIDLLLSQVADPAHDDAEARECFRALDLGSEFRAWRCVEFPGLTLHERDQSAIFHDHHDEYALAGKFCDVLPDERFEHAGGGRTIDSIAYFIDRYYVRGIASRLALSALLSVKESDGSRTRDLARRMYSQSALRSNLRLRDSMLRASLDVSSVARELRRLIDDERAYSWEVLEFEAYGKNKELMARGGSTKLLRVLAAGQARRAQDLADSDRELREILAVAASLNATVSNLRLQRRAFIISVSSAMIAVVALIVSVLAAAEKSSWFVSLLSLLGIV